jgi:hypothetical protein
MTMTPPMRPMQMMQMMRPMQMMRVLVLLTLVVATAAAQTPVKGHVELRNSTLKPRNGRVDASGVLVWLEPLDAPPPARGGPKPRRIINQRNKRFAPHVVAIETGAQVDFPNDDPFFHNVFSVYNGKRFDLGLYASGETRPVTFNRPGISYIFCNIHPQMSAVVIALDSPYFAVTDSTGAFAIPGAPDGRYRLHVWHERAKPERLEALTRVVQLTGASRDLGVLPVSEEGYLPRAHPNKHGLEYDASPNRPGYRKP